MSSAAAKNSPRRPRFSAALRRAVIALPLQRHGVDLAARRFEQFRHQIDGGAQRHEGKRLVECCAHACEVTPSLEWMTDYQGDLTSRLLRFGIVRSQFGKIAAAYLFVQLGEFARH